MSTIGYGGVSVMGACVAAIAGVAAAGVELVSACGRAVKAKLDAQEQTVAAEARTYYNSLVQQQDITNAAIAVLADNIAAQAFVVSPLAQGGGVETAVVPDTTLARQAQLQMQQAAEELRAQVAGRTAQEATNFLQQYRAQQAAMQQANILARKQRQLQAQLDEASSAGLSDEVTAQVKQVISAMESLPYDQALRHWQSALDKIDREMSAQVAPATGGDYQRTRAVQELEEALAYIQRERLATGQDPDLRNFTEAAFEHVDRQLTAAQKQVDTSPAQARKVIEEASSIMRRTMVAAAEQARHERSELLYDIEAAQARIATISRLATEMRSIGVDLQAEQPEIARAETELEAIRAAMLERKATSAHLKTSASQLRARATVLRGTLERKLAEAQRSIVATNIEEVLRSLNYGGARGATVMSDKLFDAWRVAGYKESDTGQQGAIFVVLEDERGDVRVIHEFVGFQGSECLKEKEEIFSALSKRGITLTEESQLRFNGHAHQLTIDKLVRIFNKMNYQNIHVEDIAGAVKIEAHNGPVGYTVHLSREGKADVYYDTQDGSTSQTLAELERQANETPRIETELKAQAEAVNSFRKNAQSRKGIAQR